MYGEDANWSYLIKQANNIRKEYQISYSQLLLTLRYAVEYENYKVDTEYGLGQFEKYVKRCSDFVKQIQQNKQQAKVMEDISPETVHGRQQQKYFMKEGWS